ncbi:uncharacterized protein SCHCODRAFT_02662072 [Schizophyllum commune H4-8]|uniref:Expressed protein n=1 Tax=Schizophyllum commune (strain H4-8 / FGSC 9210) TaxID=578458 RepID=D8PUY2_SCHCM|nr:uncharacterized protein SCHCODRAFT_02662072 [Schizophyllum commune H4-8]KAI5900574.1 hypothetical protein SCHCODRAFT_02662072 [Schizophyllum commune H4-8]
MNVSIPASELVPCLREAPHLRDLWIDVRTNSTLTNELLENLRLDERSETTADVSEDDSGPSSGTTAQITEERGKRLVPELERLHVSCPATFSADTLMNMVRSRTAPQRKTQPAYEDAARTVNDASRETAAASSEPASPLRYINIHCTDPALRVEPQIVARLRIMAAAGIKLFFRVGDRDVVHDGR